MEKVYVYKNSSGDFRIHPAVLLVNGGGKFRVVNSTDDTLKVTLPAGASDPTSPVTMEITPHDRGDFDAIEQGKDKTKSYNYMVVEKVSLIAAQGNSDPVLIIEN